MKLKLTTDYAIRLLLCLHGNPEILTAGELGAKVNIPRPTVIRIMLRLKSKGWVFSQEGVYGGYRMTKELKDITLLDVLSAMGDGIDINLYLSGRGSGLEYAEKNSIRDAYARLQMLLQKVFGSVTLDKVLENDLNRLEEINRCLCEWKMPP